MDDMDEKCSHCDCADDWHVSALGDKKEFIKQELKKQNR